MGSGKLIKHMVTRSGILLLVKLLGIAARIPLIRVLGAEGIGLYQMAYAFYGFALTVVSGGLPTSLTMATAENDSTGRRILKRLAFPILFFSSIAGLFLYYFSERLAASLGNNQLAFPIRCIAPAIVIVPLLALLRGYLQGRNNHGWIALSELIEQAIRLTFMILLVFAWLPYGLSNAIGGAMIGAFAGAVGAFVFLLASPLLFSDVVSNTYPRQSSEIVQNELSFFLFSSITITATRFIIPLSDFLDAYIVPNRLQASGYSLSEAVSIFGELTGMGALVVYIPTLITSALAYTLWPKLVTDRTARRNTAFVHRSEFALRFGWLWGSISAWFLYAYAEPLSLLFFHDISAAKAIRYMALVPILAGLRELSTVILWAKGDKKHPLQGLVLAIAGSVLCNYFLVAIPGYGYIGAVIGILCLELTATVWNLLMLMKAERISLFFFQTMFQTAQLLLCVTLVHYAFQKFEILLPFNPLLRETIQMSFVYSAGLYYLVIKLRKMKFG